MAKCQRSPVSSPYYSNLPPITILEKSFLFPKRTEIYKKFSREENLSWTSFTSHFIDLLKCITSPLKPLQLRLIFLHNSQIHIFINVIEYGGRALGGGGELGTLFTCHSRWFWVCVCGEKEAFRRACVCVFHVDEKDCCRRILKCFDFSFPLHISHFCIVFLQNYQFTTHWVFICFV